MKLFKDLGLSDELFTVIDNLKFTKPTEIQEKSIPHILNGRDVIGASATGSGKTLAFGCGIIENTIPRKGLQALVLVPTRELAEQVKDSLKQLSYSKRLEVTAVYGGVSINPQIRNLRKTEIVVATPGRLLDHLQRGTIDTSHVKVLVMDEADRMFDMGFIEDVEKIVQTCPKKRQTLFFSATISSEIDNLSKRHMIDPIKVSAVKHVDPSKLKQIYYDVSKNKKLSLIIHLLKEDKVGQAMVFCNTRRTTDFVVKNLKNYGIKATSLHGGLTQNRRTGVIKSFDRGEVLALVCTDVAARGLHIDNVSHIYNYEIPLDPKDYVHRIGRTARAGEEGEAINLLSNNDFENFSRVTHNYRDFKISKEETPMLEDIKAVKVENKFRGKSSFRGRSSVKPFVKGKSDWKSRSNSSWKGKSNPSWKGKSNPSWKKKSYGNKSSQGKSFSRVVAY